jgi:hypothetical protein
LSLSPDPPREAVGRGEGLIFNDATD